MSSSKTVQTLYH